MREWARFVLGVVLLSWPFWLGTIVPAIEGMPVFPLILLYFGMFLAFARTSDAWRDRYEYDEHTGRSKKLTR